MKHVNKYFLNLLFLQLRNTKSDLTLSVLRGVVYAFYYVKYIRGFVLYLSRFVYNT